MRDELTPKQERGQRLHDAAMDAMYTATENLLIGNAKMLRDLHEAFVDECKNIYFNTTGRDLDLDELPGTHLTDLIKEIDQAEKNQQH